MQRIGKYEIVDTIGRGAMGIVYRGYDRRLDRYVAIKTMFANLLEDRDVYGRFLKEAQALARMHHPNIVLVHEMDEHEGAPYIVMELLEGSDLKRLLTESGRPALNRVADILGQAAAGLECAHRHGIVHRDIKPANLFFTTDGTVKIVDFGVARLLEARSQTKSGIAVGTVAYMSPEQARGERVEAPSDQFSLGVIAYELLQGDVPFKAETLTGVLMKIISDPPPPFRVDAGYPPALMAAVMRALDKSPANRFPSVTAFAEAFKAATLRPFQQPPQSTIHSGRVAVPPPPTAVQDSRTLLLPSGPLMPPPPYATGTAQAAPQRATASAGTPVPPVSYRPQSSAEIYSRSSTNAIPPPVMGGAATGSGKPAAAATNRVPRPPARKNALPWVLSILCFAIAGVIAVLLLLRPWEPRPPEGPGPNPPPASPGNAVPASGPTAPGTGAVQPPTGNPAEPASQEAQLLLAAMNNAPGAVTGTQAILVVTPNDESREGNLFLLEKAGETWKTHSACPAGVGQKGFSRPGNKQEGDGSVPSGIFSLGPAFGYEAAIDSAMEYFQVSDQDYWIVDPSSPKYNRVARSPSPPSGVMVEKLRRSDSQYALALVIQYNLAPAVPGKGSAIFLCLPPASGAPVSGCVIISRMDMEMLLKWLSPSAAPRIVMGSAADLRNARLDKR